MRGTPPSPSQTRWALRRSPPPPGEENPRWRALGCTIGGEELLQIPLRAGVWQVCTKRHPESASPPPGSSQLRLLPGFEGTLGQWQGCSGPRTFQYSTCLGGRSPGWDGGAGTSRWQPKHFLQLSTTQSSDSICSSFFWFLGSHPTELRS